MQEKQSDTGKKTDTVKKTPSLFRFFSRWFILGLFIIFISCFIALVWPTSENPLHEFLRMLIPNLLQTVGIAFMLGVIFDFSKNSQDFIEFISLLLSDIVIGKTFLSKLEPEGRSEALSLILRPSENQVKQYSRIDDYFEKKISDVMQMWDTNFKTNTVITIRICKDPLTNKVQTVGTLTYRIYKVKDKYSDIVTTFERNGSRVSSTEILHPGGSFPILIPEPKQDVVAGIEYTKFEFRVPDELYQYPYLTIKRDIYEPGYDHWTNFHWTSLTPYDGLVFHMTCEDGLTIKEHIVFDAKSLYNVDVNKARTEMRIVSTDWLEANTGFSVTISTSAVQEEVDPDDNVIQSVGLPSDTQSAPNLSADEISVDKTVKNT